MNATLPDGTGREFMERIKNAGFDYLELPLAQTYALSEDDFASLVSQVAKTGLSVEACNNCFPTFLRLTGSNVDESEVSGYVKKAFKRVSVLGAGIVVFGSGPAKNIPEGFPESEGYDQIVTLLRRMSDEAGKYGITIAIEPLRKAECNVINTFREGVVLAKRVDRPNVKVLADFYHMSVEKEDPDVLATYSDYLVHAHFANPALGKENERSFPLCTDEWDYEPFFTALGKAGYEGRLSLEAYTMDFDRDAPRAIEVMRTLSK